MTPPEYFNLQPCSIVHVGKEGGGRTVKWGGGILNLGGKISLGAKSPRGGMGDGAKSARTLYYKNEFHQIMYF